jgi:hypothetical protein
MPRIVQEEQKLKHYKALTTAHDGGKAILVNMINVSTKATDGSKLSIMTK